MGHNDYMEERSFDTVDTFVCADCVIDRTLANLVNNNLASNSCAYCKSESGGLIAAPFEVLMERIYESICAYYADAQDIGIPWNGGWILSETEPSDILGEFDPGWSCSFFDDVLDCMGGVTTGSMK